MQNWSEAEAPEPNPFRAVWKHAAIVASLVIFFAVLAAVVAANRPDSYLASASIVIEDPSGVALFSTARAADTERYVANQVALLRSSALAERASELSSAADPPREITPGDFIRDTTVSVTPETELVKIEFEAGDPITAQLGANSVALAYEGFVQDLLVGEVLETTDNLDSAIEGVSARIADLQNEIDGLQATSSDRAALDGQVADIVSELAALRHAGLPAEEAAAIAQQLTSELEARRLLIELELQQGPVVMLLRQQTDAVELLSSLYSQRSQIALDASVAGNGVALYSPAAPGQPKGVSLLAASVIGAALGGMLGLGTAYFLETRDWTFSNQIEPQQVLGVPVLAQIPEFGEERLENRLPARDSPGSASAESFRFLTVAIDRAQTPGQTSRSVAVISGTLGEGKTTVVANTAFSASQEGLNVLVLDADIGSRGLSTLFAGEFPSGKWSPFGITDLVVGGRSFDDIGNVIPLANGAQLTVISFGETHVDPISFFRSAETQRVLSSIRSQFDLFLIDVPPILEVAYATPLLSFVDEVIVIVPHGSDSAGLYDTRNRLELLGISPTGYVYNRAPLRRKRLRTGSLASAHSAPPGETETAGS
jgi:Mrp family chromosome partitioning ATPase